MQDVFVSFYSAEFSLSVYSENLWSQKLNGLGFPQWKVLVCCICSVSSCQNVLLFILHLKGCHEKINVYTWEKENFFSVFFTVCVQVISNEHWKGQNNLKMAMNEKVLDQISSLAQADTPFMSSHHTWSKSLCIWTTTPHKTLSPLTWINTE